MKKYRVSVEIQNTAEVVVEASSEEEAFNNACDLVADGMFSVSSGYDVTDMLETADIEEV